MVARTSSDAELELTEHELSDAAYLRADGRAWEAVAVLLGLAAVPWLAVRRAAEGDPRFAPLLKRASKAAAKDAEAVALRRLKAYAEKDDPKVAVKASQVLTEYAAEQARNETRLKVERLRAEVEREKLAARAKGDDEFDGPAPVWPTREEERARIERWQTEEAAAEDAEVYLWGGNHVTNVGVEPDATDQRVYIQWDHSFGRSVYWVVPECAYLASGRGDRPIRPDDLHEKSAPDLLWSGHSVTGTRGDPVTE